MRRALIPLLVLLVAGCGKREEVRRYRAPKDPGWRMLAAIAPGRDFTWFFKVVGPAEHVGSHGEEVTGFLRSLRLEEGEVRWTLPKGWTGSEGSGDRQSSIQFGKRDPKIEMTVVRLAGDGGGPLANVNRWRDQMGLAKIGQDGLEGAVRKVTGQGLESLLVDLEGPKRPSMRPPQRMARGGGGGGQPTLDDVRAMFAYEVPSGWVENPSPGQGRIFEFQAGEALVTFSILGGEGGGLAANLNRWRGQAGLAPLAEDEAPSWTKQVRFLGRPGWSTEAVGKDRAVLVTFSLNPEFSMFLKMDGTPAAVGAQREAFEALARSFRMGGPGG